MAAITFGAFNFLETISLDQSQIEVRVCTVDKYITEHKPLRIQWLRDTDSNGRAILRSHWEQER